MARGNYTPDEIKRMSDLDLAFISHYQNLVEQERQKFWTDALGIIWDKGDFLKKSEGPKVKIQNDTMFIPLSLVIKPDLMDSIKENFGLSKDGKKKKPHIGGGDYNPKANEVIHSMDDISKDEFKRMFGN